MFFWGNNYAESLERTSCTILEKWSTLGATGVDETLKCLLHLALTVGRCVRMYTYGRKYLLEMNSVISDSQNVRVLLGDAPSTKRRPRWLRSIGTDRYNSECNDASDSKGSDGRDTVNVHDDASRRFLLPCHGWSINHVTYRFFFPFSFVSVEPEKLSAEICICDILSARTSEILITLARCLLLSAVMFAGHRLARRIFDELP